MRILFFILLTWSSLSFSKEPCSNTEQSVMDFYSKNISSSKKDQVLVDKLVNKELDFWKVTEVETCGASGCEFVLIYGDKNHCLNLIFEGNGQIVIKEGNDLQFTYLERSLAVDALKKQKRHYQFNLQTRKIEFSK